MLRQSRPLLVCCMAAGYYGLPHAFVGVAHTLADISPSAAHDELCINLPSGIYLSASFSSFQACILAQGIVPTAGCCVGVGSRHVGTVLFCSFLVLSYLHYNNDRERPISVLMCDAAAGFSITYLMRALHRISTGTRHIPVYLHKRYPFYGCNRDVAQAWVAARRPQGYGSSVFSPIQKAKGTVPLNETAHFLF